MPTPAFDVRDAEARLPGAKLRGEERSRRTRITSHVVPHAGSDPACGLCGVGRDPGNRLDTFERIHVARVRPVPLHICAGIASFVMLDAPLWGYGGERRGSVDSVHGCIPPIRSSVLLPRTRYYERHTT